MNVYVLEKICFDRYGFLSSSCLLFEAFSDAHDEMMRQMNADDSRGETSRALQEDGKWAYRIFKNEDRDEWRIWNREVEKSRFANKGDNEMVDGPLPQKGNIRTIKIEPRSNGNVWNLTMFVSPPKGEEFAYRRMIQLAERVIREAKGLGEKWTACNADIMAWSSDRECGIHDPHEYRITLDMVSDEYRAAKEVEE